MQGRWKEYVEMALERGAFCGVVSAACLMTPESVQWVVDGEECDSQLKEKGLVVYTWGAENNDARERLHQAEMGVDAIIADSFV